MLTPKKSRILAALSVVVAVTFAVFAAGCSSNPSKSRGGSDAPATSSPVGRAPSHITVHIREYAFDPKSATIRDGGTITFVNDDRVTHTGTAPDGAFDTGNIAAHKSATVTVHAAKTGKIPYICSIHQFMTGSIDVVQR